MKPAPERDARAREIWSASKAELLSLLRGGRAVDPNALAGHDFRGVSLGLPGFVEALTWKTFRKSFSKNAEGGVDGLNVKLVQSGVDAQPEPKRTADGSPVTFGPFAVVPLPSCGTPFGCKEGVVFDYAARHPAWHPMAPSRDVVVALDEGGTLLLGALYLDLPLGRLRTPSFFTLERED